jgi:hypothetical protein
MTLKDVKTKEQVLNRLKKLRIRYARQYISESQKRVHANCTYNLEITSTNHKDESKFEYDIMPRKVHITVLNNPPTPIRLCMYGSEKIDEWPGSLCDSDLISAKCPYFKPKISFKEAEKSYLELLKDDKYVFDHYKDMATLQWVLNYRIYESHLSIFDKIKIKFLSVIIFLKSLMKPRQSNQSLPELPEGLWDDDSA